jgi:4-hydroxy-tetrahydrodipicolinate reductase
VNVAVFGAKGRVGRAVVRLAKGHNVWQIDKDFEHNPLQTVDVVVDFSLPTATKSVVDFCKAHHCPLVTGVTGRSEIQLALLDELAQQVAVVASDNFSDGVQMLADICQYVAQNCNWACEIVETHHAHKKDSPSGTAKMLASKIAKAAGEFCGVTVHSLRLGSNFGQHMVVFGTNGESLTITHQAENVEIFARGALKRALQLAENNKKH